MTPAIDYRLYLVVGPHSCHPNNLVDMVAAAVKGGVTMVQLRCKESDDQTWLSLGSQLQQLLNPLQIPLIINDRVDIALKLNARGVHLGQKDMPPTEARALLGKDKIIGLSVEHMEQLPKALTEPVDYLGIGPIFPTRSKHDAAPPWGLQTLTQATAACHLPVVAIGGIDATNTEAIMESGAAGIALISYICQAEDPAQASQNLRQLIDRHYGAIHA